MKLFRCLLPLGTLLFLAIPALAQPISVINGNWVDAAYDSERHALYAVSANNHRLGRINSETGVLEQTYSLPGKPTVVAITESRNYLWIGLEEQASMVRFDLQAWQVDQRIDLTVPGDPDGPYYALDLLPNAGSDRQVYVSLASRCCAYYPRGVAMYNTTGRFTNIANGVASLTSLTHSDTPDIIFGHNSLSDWGAIVALVRNGGQLSITNLYAGFPGDGRNRAIHYNNRRMITNGGGIYSVRAGVPMQVVDLSTSPLFDVNVSLTQVTTPGGQFVTFTEKPRGEYEIIVYDANTFLPANQADIPVPEALLGSTAREFIPLDEAQTFALITDNHLALIRTCDSEDLPAPGPYLGNHEICPDGPLQITASAQVAAGGQLFWSTGDLGNSTTISREGQYYYHYINNEGCSGPITTFTINRLDTDLPPAPRVEIVGSNIICDGDYTVLRVRDAPEDGQVIRWSTGATGRTITVEQSGNYSASILLAGSECGSPESNQVNIIVEDAPPSPEVEAVGSTVACTGGTVELRVRTDPGPGRRIRWNNGATGTTLFAEESGSYYAIVEDLSLQCNSAPSNEVAVTIGVDLEQPQIQLVGQAAICAGQTTEIRFQGTLSNGQQVRWNNGTLGQSLIVTAPGAYSAIVVDSEAGCSSPSSNAITISAIAVPQRPQVQALGSTTLCAGTSVELRVTQAPGNGEVIRWSTGATGQAIQVSESGQYSAVVETDNPGCDSPVSNTVTVRTLDQLAPPQVQLIGSPTICEGEFVELRARDAPGGGAQVRWSTGDVGRSLFVREPGTYSAVVVGANGQCSSPTSNNVTINVLPAPAPPQVRIVGNTTLCAGQSVELEVPNAPGGGAEVHWSTGDIGPRLTVRETGNYSAVIVDANAQCTSLPSNSVSITAVDQLPPPQIQVIGSPTLCAGESVELRLRNAPGGGAQVRWSNGATGRSLYVNTAGSYSAVVLAVNSQCSSPTSNIVTVRSVPEIAPPQIRLIGASTICPGDSVELRLRDQPSDGFEARWNTGNTGASLFVHQAGSYSAVLVDDESQCTSLSSNTLTTSVNTVALLPAPQLSFDPSTNTLTSSAPGPLVWYLNGVRFLVTDGSSLVVTSRGDYAASRFDATCDNLPVSAVVRVDMLVATEGQFQQLGIDVFPNPTSDYLHLRLPHTAGADFKSLRLYDQLGRRVRSQPLTAGAEERLDLRSVAPGTYLLELSSEGRRVVVRSRIVRQ